MENQNGFANTVQSRGSPILLVDEDGMMREMLRIALHREGFCLVTAACTASEALQFTRTLLPDVLLLDYELSGMTGFQLYEQILRESHRQPLPAILVSAPLLVKERELRPLWIVQEPFDLDTLLACIEQALRFASLRRTEGSVHRQKEVGTKR